MPRRRSSVEKRLCQLCWQERNPGSYPGESIDMDECFECGDFALLYADGVDVFDDLPPHDEADMLPGYGREDDWLEAAYEDRYIDPMTTDLPDEADSAEEFFA